MGQLYYGENLHILRDHIPDGSIDLVYLDPPFNSNRTYNLLFKSSDGNHADSQITAFADTWTWTEQTTFEFEEVTECSNHSVIEMMTALRRVLGESDMMAYLVMMTNRLMELHRILRATGSLYLHCDPTASHYLKIVLDAIFGPQNFQNHIIWQRSDTHNDAKYRFPAVSDHIFLYSKSSNHTFNKQFTKYPESTLKNWYLFLELPDGTVRKMTKEERETQQIPVGARRFNADNMTSPNPRPNLMYTYKGYPYPTKGWRYSLETMKELDEKGLLLFPSSPDGRIMRKRYLDEQDGVTLGDVWTDISQLRASMAEALGYPTQKPLALLERIIQASSNPGDIVLDPFCGCGTAIDAAEKLNRQWIGIDITHHAIDIIEERLEKNHPGTLYKIHGRPSDIGGARKLAVQDKYHFQRWACSLINAVEYQGGRKGADGGVDGFCYFEDLIDGKRKKCRAIVSVKGGKNISLTMLKDLIATVQGNNAEFGIFITLTEPTKPMLVEAAKAGFYLAGDGCKYPKIQVFTIEELIDGRRPQLPEKSFEELSKRKQVAGRMKKMQTGARRPAKGKNVIDLQAKLSQE